MMKAFATTLRWNGTSRDVLWSTAILSTTTGEWSIWPGHMNSLPGNQEVSPLHTAWCSLVDSCLLLQLSFWLQANKLKYYAACLPACCSLYYPRPYPAIYFLFLLSSFPLSSSSSRQHTRIRGCCVFIIDGTFTRTYRLSRRKYVKNEKKRTKSFLCNNYLSLCLSTTLGVASAVCLFFY